MAENILRHSTTPQQVHLGPSIHIMSLAYLLQCCDLFVGSDTGPMHLAAAMGAPVVCIFGPTSPELNRPLASGGFRAVHLGLQFPPSGKRAHRYLECVREISVEQVFQAVAELVREKRGEADLPEQEEQGEEELVTAAVLAGPIQAQVIVHLLEEENIPHLIHRFDETAFNGIFVAQKGWGELRVPPNRLDWVKGLVAGVEKSSPGPPGEEKKPENDSPTE